MPVIPESVFDKYNEMADLVITEINKTTITLHYSDLVVQDVTLDANLPPNIDQYGGRTPIDNWTDRAEQGGVGYKQEDRTEDIIVRLYWQSVKIFDPASKVMIMDSKNKAKINAFAYDMQRLVNAKFITVQHQGRNINLKMTIPPVPYGLRDKRYCISFWEEIDG